MKKIFILVVALLAVGLLVGCGSTVEYTLKTSSGEIKGNLKAFNSEEINATTKQVATLITINDSSLAASDRAIQLMYITSMKDRDVHIVPYGNYGGYYGYQGSRQQTRDMEIDAINRYQQYKQSKTINNFSK